MFVVVVFFILLFPFFIRLNVEILPEKKICFCFKIFCVLRVFWGSVYQDKNRIIFDYYNLYKKKINFKKILIKKKRIKDVKFI
jgi:hypothetical protein